MALILLALQYVLAAIFGLAAFLVGILAAIVLGALVGILLGPTVGVIAILAAIVLYNYFGWGILMFVRGFDLIMPEAQP